jgi:hypothetical protein
MPAQKIREGRITVSLELLQLALRDIAGLPAMQQEDVREAVKRLQSVQEWCKAHSEFSAHGETTLYRR